MIKSVNRELDEELSLKLFIVINRALEAIRKKATNDVKQYGLNLTEFGVLELLYHKGPQPIQVIGKKVLLASSSITYVIDKLEEKELIVRESCPAGPPCHPRAARGSRGKTDPRHFPKASSDDSGNVFQFG